jgi:hypothetical protein
MLAQSVCETQWRLERARKNEVNILALPHFEELPEGIAGIQDPAERNAMIAAYAYTKYEKALRNLDIQEGRLQRALSQGLTDFRSLQEDRQTAAYNKMTEAINARDYHHVTERPSIPPNLASFLQPPKSSRKSRPATSRLTPKTAAESPNSRLNRSAPPGSPAQGTACCMCLRVRNTNLTWR